MNNNDDIKKKYWLYGNCPKTCYEYITRIENKLERKITVLIPDSLDGYTTMPFLKAGQDVTCYETNKVLLSGGIIDDFLTTGFSYKLSTLIYNGNLKIQKENFYEQPVIEKYDFVYSYRSLHMERNSHTPLKRKVQKLLTSVKIGGYVYIFYYLNDSKNLNISSNTHFNPYEMKSYFDLNNWEILYSIEGHTRGHKSHPFNNKNHNHKTGSIFARKKNHRKKIIYRYVYSIK